jgi:hypothetical protein
LLTFIYKLNILVTWKLARRFLVGISVNSALATIYVLLANFWDIWNADMVKALPLFSSLSCLQLLTPERHSEVKRVFRPPPCLTRSVAFFNQFQLLE